MTGPIIIIGGQAAGMSAAMQIRRRHSKAPVVIFEKSKAFSYATCGMPYLLDRSVRDPELLMLRSRTDLKNRYSIDIQTESEAVAVFPARRSVAIRDPNGIVRETGYAKLLIATGASPTIPQPLKHALRGITSFRFFGDAVDLLEQLKEEPNNRQVVVLGGGVLGCVMASVLASQCHRIAIVERERRLLPDWLPFISEAVSATLLRSGVQIQTNTVVERIESRSGVVEAVITSGCRRIPASIVVVAAGIRPATDWLEGSGIDRNAFGAIRVSRRMETSRSGIYAAGDCCETYHRVLRRSIYLPHGTTANLQGICAGDNMTGHPEDFQGSCGAKCAKIGELEIARTGVTGLQCLNEGIDTSEVMIDHFSRSKYYPGAEPIRLALFADRRMNRVIGCEMIGKEGVSKRVDVVTTAVCAGLSPAQLSMIDFTYSPPLAPSKDPVMLAALRLSDRSNPDRIS